MEATKGLDIFSSHSSQESVMKSVRFFLLHADLRGMVRKRVSALLLFCLRHTLDRSSKDLKRLLCPHGCLEHAKQIFYHQIPSPTNTTVCRGFLNNFPSRRAFMCQKHNEHMNQADKAASSSTSVLTAGARAAGSSSSLEEASFAILSFGGVGGALLSGTMVDCGAFLRKMTNRSTWSLDLPEANAFRPSATFATNL